MSGDVDARDRLCADLRLVADGNREAMSRVYQATSAKLYGICLRILKERDGADEVLQEVYIKVWHRAGRFDELRASPITWLCVIARNTAIDWRRAAIARGTLDPQMLTLAVDEPPADMVLERRQEHRRVLECLDLIDRNQARAVRAAFFDGYTYLELAEREDVPLGTMKSWIRRGLIRLRQCLDDV